MMQSAKARAVQGSVSAEIGVAFNLALQQKLTVEFMSYTKTRTLNCAFLV